MEYIVAFLIFIVPIFFVVFVFVYFTKFLDKNIKQIKDKLKVQSDTNKNEQEKQKLRFLNAITGIHSAGSSLSLRKSVLDFYQCIKYHKNYKLNFYDRDLNKLEITIEKYIKYKLYKIYGINENQDVLMAYQAFLKNR